MCSNGVNMLLKIAFLILQLIFVLTIVVESRGTCAFSEGLLECDGVESIPKDVVDISSLLIKHYNITKLLQYYLSFPLMKTLIVSNCDFQYITDEALSSMKELLYLDISYSEVRSIASNAFLRNLKLRRIHLTFDNISTIPPNLFFNLLQANDINLKGNNLETIFRGTFSTNSKLRKLDLSQNNVKIIQNGAFNISDVHLTRSDKDVVLNISHNRLLELDNGTFARCRSVTVLDLSHNRLRALHTSSLEGLDALRKLLLVNNQLTALVIDLPSIRFLDVSGNCLWELRRGAWLRLGEVPLDDYCEVLLQRFLSAEGLNETDCSSSTAKYCELGCDDAELMEHCDFSHNRSSRYILNESTISTTSAPELDIITIPSKSNDHSGTYHPGIELSDSSTSEGGTSRGKSMGIFLIIITVLHLLIQRYS